MKTAELTGAALDWAVAKCEGHQWRCPWMLKQDGYEAWQSYEAAWGNPTPSYSTNWAQGGPLIEREGISTTKSADQDYWWAGSWDARHTAKGPTPLIAAMRCLVASKLGDNIAIPEELK